MLVEWCYLATPLANYIASAIASCSLATSTDPRPPHVPDFLPAFPEKRTYVHTATSNVRAADGPAAKKRRTKNRRQAQDSLLNFADAERAAAIQHYHLHVSDGAGLLLMQPAYPNLFGDPDGWGRVPPGVKMTLKKGMK